MGTRRLIKSICDQFKSDDPTPWRSASEQLIELVTDRQLAVAELAAVAISIAESGTRVNLPEGRRYADVPSTGGPASLSTLLCPILLAAAGVSVPKISATGSVAGGIDTLALVPGYRESLKDDEFVGLVANIGIAHTVQTTSFCPADAVLLKVRRERGLMGNPELAAVSLLAKKVAVPGCGAAFDFRLGDTGNIGSTLQEGRRAADLFHEVASVLGITIGTILTDNRTFPCSALGRLESLELLMSVLDGVTPQMELDEQHLSTCVRLAAEAVQLSGGDAATAISEMKGLVESGKARELLLKHLSAQGGSAAGLRGTLRLRSQQPVRELVADASGFWQPPALLDASKWIKKEQRVTGSAPDQQIGLRLKISPGAEVRRGDVVAEVRCPSASREFSVPIWLSGLVTPSPSGSNVGILGARSSNQDWRWNDSTVSHPSAVLNSLGRRQIRS